MGRNPFFIRSIVPTIKTVIGAADLQVAIPSSSGQSFQQTEKEKAGERAGGRNPFFIRSIVPTDKSSNFREEFGVAIPSSSGQSFQLQKF